MNRAEYFKKIGFSDETRYNMPNELFTCPVCGGYMTNMDHVTSIETLEDVENYGFTDYACLHPICPIQLSIRVQRWQAMAIEFENKNMEK